MNLDRAINAIVPISFSAMGFPALCLGASVREVPHAASKSGAFSSSLIAARQAGLPPNRLAHWLGVIDVLTESNRLGEAVGVLHWIVR